MATTGSYNRQPQSQRKEPRVLPCLRELSYSRNGHTVNASVPGARCKRDAPGSGPAQASKLTAPLPRS
jgi:hypothetical protein